MTNLDQNISGDQIVGLDATHTWWLASARDDWVGSDGEEHDSDHDHPYPSQP